MAVARERDPGHQHLDSTGKAFRTVFRIRLVNAVGPFDAVLRTGYPMPAQVARAGHPRQPDLAPLAPIPGQQGVDVDLSREGPVGSQIKLWLEVPLQASAEVFALA
jgi:hypothetical protein